MIWANQLYWLLRTGRCEIVSVLVGFLLFNIYVLWLRILLCQIKSYARYCVMWDWRLDCVILDWRLCYEIEDNFFCEFEASVSVRSEIMCVAMYWCDMCECCRADWPGWRRRLGGWSISLALYWLYTNLTVRQPVDNMWPGVSQHGQTSPAS